VNLLGRRNAYGAPGCRDLFCHRDQNATFVNPVNPVHNDLAISKPVREAARRPKFSVKNPLTFALQSPNITLTAAEPVSARHDQRLAPDRHVRRSNECQ
jgi:hypothetical protein